MKKPSAGLLQQQAIEKVYNDFKAMNGAGSCPFDIFSAGFASGIVYQKTLVKNRAKQNKSKNKK